MTYVARFVDWLLYTSLYTACCATGLCIATERLITGTNPALLTQLHTLVFGSTLLVYNSPRILRMAYAHENNSQGLLRNYRFWYFLFLGIGLVLSVFSLFSLSLPMLAACGILGIVAFAYSLPLLPFAEKKRLREYGWLKIGVLTTVWTIATSVLPILYHQKNISNYPFELMLRFVFIFSLCLLFDIRDMETDLQHNVYTLPNKIGVTNSLRLISGLLVLFVLLGACQYVRYPSAARLVSIVVTAILTRTVAGYLQRNPTDRAYMGLADGVMLVYSLLVIIPY